MTTGEGASWRTLHRAIVLDTKGAVVGGRSCPRVLVVPVPAEARAAGEEWWAVPSWEVDEPREHDPDVGRFAGQAHERIGVEVVVLRYVDPVEDGAARMRSGTWVLELHGVGGPGAASGGKWVTRGELAGLRHADGETWRVVDGVLGDLEEGRSPAGRCAWSEPGWFDAATTWMAAQLKSVGRPHAGAIEQFRNNSISSVLRAHTAVGDVYFKAASRHFANEARITRGLAQRFTDHLPVVLAADVERSWLVLEDFGEAIRWAGIDAWEETLCIMGDLQRRCVAETDWVRSIGAADRRLAVLREQIPALLDAPETRAELEPALVERLIARIPELQDACDALAARGVPETLIHGDLHAGNVARKGGRITIFDWTDAAVGHPFLDLVTFLPSRRRRPDGVEDAAAAAKRLLDAYLEGWTAFAPLAQLRRAVALLETVARLHHAQSYLQILRSVEPADYWQWEGELANWLRPIAKGETGNERASA